MPCGNFDTLAMKIRQEKLNSTISCMKNELHNTKKDLHNSEKSVYISCMHIVL